MVAIFLGNANFLTIKLSYTQKVKTDKSKPSKHIIDDGLLLHGTILMIIAKAKHQKNS